MLFWGTVSCLHGAAVECIWTGRASPWGQVLPIPPSYQQLLVLPCHGRPSSLPLCPCSPFLLASAFADTAQPQRNRAVLACPAALSAVPASHAGTCSGHFLLPASVAATLGASLVFLPSYPLASPLSLKLFVLWLSFYCSRLGVWCLPSTWSQSTTIF